jgi:hypothetical protein
LVLQILVGRQVQVLELLEIVVVHQGLEHLVALLDWRQGAGVPQGIQELAALAQAYRQLLGQVVVVLVVTLVGQWVIRKEEAEEGLD